MTIEVPQYRRVPQVRGIQATLPVGATEWGDMSRLHNWLKGQPRCLIPGIYHDQSLGFADSDDFTMALRFYPSGYHHTRWWTVRAVGTGDVEYTIGSNAAASAAPGREPGAGSAGLLDAIGEYTFVEELASLPTGMSAVDVDFRFVVGESDSWALMDLSCWEVPMPFLPDAEGQSVARIVSGQPIVAADVATLRSGAADMLIGHRMLGAYAVPYAFGATPTVTTTYAASTTSGTFGDLWNADIPALARNTTQTPGDSASVVYADVFAWVNAGQAEVRISGTGGAGGVTAATTISATTPTWVTTAALEVDVEDLSTATGMPSNAFETVALEGRVTTATTLYVASAILYESTT